MGRGPAPAEISMCIAGMQGRAPAVLPNPGDLGQQVADDEHLDCTSTASRSLYMNCNCIYYAPAFPFAVIFYTYRPCHHGSLDAAGVSCYAGAWELSHVLTEATDRK